MKINSWNIEAITGYEPKTTFYEDFSIAEVFGMEAMKDTFERCFEEWKSNTEYITELTMAMNWKSWEHDASGNTEFCEWYSDKWLFLDRWCMNNLAGTDLTYYLRTTD